MSSFPQEFQRSKNETQEEYLKRLNETTRRCTSCNKVYANSHAYKNYAICTACQKGEADGK